MTTITDTFLRKINDRRAWLVWLSVALVLIVSFALGNRPSIISLSLLIAVASAIVLLRRPLLGIFGLTLAALLPKQANLPIGTGTEGIGGIDWIVNAANLSLDCY